MEWLTRWWQELFRDVLVLGTGLGIIVYEVVFVNPPNLGALGTGLALTGPSAYVRLKEIGSSRNGSSGLPSPPPGPEPSSLTHGDTRP